MNAEPLSVLKLVGDASIVVQLVLGLLLAASIASWAIILGKRSVLARARGEAERFEASFWSGGDLGSLYINSFQDFLGGAGRGQFGTLFPCVVDQGLKLLGHDGSVFFRIN